MEEMLQIEPQTVSNSLNFWEICTFLNQKDWVFHINEEFPVLIM